MIDICNLGQFAPVFQFFPQTLAAPVLTVEMGKFGVTSYYVNDHANALLAASLMGTHCPRVRVITTLSRLFFRPWKSCRTDSSVCIVHIRSPMPMPMPMPIPIPIPTAASTRVIVGWFPISIKPVIDQLQPNRLFHTHTYPPTDRPTGFPLLSILRVARNIWPTQLNPGTTGLHVHPSGLEARSSVKAPAKNAMHRREFVKRSRRFSRRTEKRENCTAVPRYLFLCRNYRPFPPSSSWRPTVNVSGFVSEQRFGPVKREFLLGDGPPVVQRLLSNSHPLTNSFLRFMVTLFRRFCTTWWHDSVSTVSACIRLIFLRFNGCDRQYEF